MIYLARGGHRTGSTLAYEIMAYLGRHVNLDIKRLLTDEEILNRARFVKHCVGRSHTFDFSEPNPGIKILYTNRCPYARVASVLRMNHRMPIEKFFKAGLAAWQQELLWAKSNHYVTVFEYPTCIGKRGVENWICAIEDFMDISGVDTEPLVELLDPDRLQKMSKLPLEEIRKRKEVPIWHDHVGKCSTDMTAWTLAPEMMQRVHDLFPDHHCVECEHAF